MRSCPACRRAWPDRHEVCPDCLAQLVADLDATITCRQCGQVCPSRMQACTSCFALLRAEDADMARSQARAMATGRPLHRPPGRPPFEAGPGCTVRRLAGGGPLVLVGVDGFVEATVEGSAPIARPPLRCTADDAVLFRLAPYEAAAAALVATGPDGAAVATFLRAGTLLDPVVDVRDGTSAPVARLQRVRRGAGWQLLETGTDHLLATVAREEVEGDDWLDDGWSVTPVADHRSVVPLPPLAYAALAVALKVLLGRPRAIEADRPDGDGVDL